MWHKLPSLLLGCGFLGFCALAPSTLAQQAQKQETQQQLKGYYAVRPLNASPEALNKALAGADTLPLWRYTVTASRDSNTYSGIMVGTDPSVNQLTGVPTVIVPLIFKMPDGGVFDPTVPDPCAGTGTLSDLQLVQGSPIVLNAPFTFGGTDVGSAQYVDAFQRANFWTASPNGGSGVEVNTNHHTRLNISIAEPIVVNVPPGGGATWTGLGCGNFGVINIAWFDSGLVGVTQADYLTTRIFPLLQQRGLLSANKLPVFLMPNVTMAIFSVSPFFNCCILGYHGAVLDANGNVQTYSPVDFDSTGAFGPAVADTSIMSHEVAEWMNDPFGGNPVPAWGHVGQQGGCQGNLEVGDPLTGTNMPPVTMANGFTYHLQELAFFSWFYGAPSIAANGWFSDNNTFTSDAGAVCQ
jgi:hypothetical protein